MKACWAVVILTCVLAPAWAGEPDTEALQRQLEKKATDFAKAVGKMVSRCKRCRGTGRVRNDMQRWKPGPGGNIYTCPTCKGSTYEVSKTWYQKVFWKMRSHTYRTESGMRKSVTQVDFDALRKVATPLSAGRLDSVELLDDRHGVSWHRHKGKYYHFKWIYEEKRGWSWYTPPWDGAWPPSNIDFGYPGASASDFLEGSYDKFEDRTIVRTKTLGLQNGLTAMFGYSHDGAACSDSIDQAVIVFHSTSKSWRFLKSVQRKAIFIADGRRFEIRKLDHDGKVKLGGVTETLSGALPTQSLRYIADATRVEGRVGIHDDARFTLSRTQRLVLRELVRRLDKVSQAR